MLRYVLIILPLILILSYIGNTVESINHFIIPSILALITTVGWLNFRHYSTLQKGLVIYISITIINQVTAYYFGLYYHNSYVILHYYVIAQLITLAIIYSYTLKMNTALKILIATIVLAFLLNSFCFGSVYDFPSMNVILLCAVLIPFSLFQFRQMIISPIDQKIENQSIFWFNFGTFIFYTFGFFLFGFLSSIDYLPNWIYDILWGANIFLFSTYFIALILDDKPKPTQP